MNKFVLTVPQLELVTLKIEQLNQGVSHGLTRLLTDFGSWCSTVTQDVVRPGSINPSRMPRIEHYAFAEMRLTLNRDGNVLVELASVDGASQPQHIKLPLSLLRQGMKGMFEVNHRDKDESLYKKVATNGNWVIRVPDYQVMRCAPGVSLNPALIEPCLELMFTIDQHSEALICTLDYNGMGA